MKNSNAILLTFVLFVFSSGAVNPAAAAAAAGVSLPVFNEKAEKLPKGYVGLDAKSFFKLYISKAEVPSGFDSFSAYKAGSQPLKSEFESSAAFESRKANATILPIRYDSLYAFASDSVSFVYDADKAVMTVSAGAHKGKYSDPSMYLNIKTLRRDYSNYSASNAYGAKVGVRKLEVERVMFGIDNNSKFHKELFIPPGSMHGEKYGLELPVTVAEAKRWKREDISILFVGKVTGRNLSEVNLHLQSPTMTKPEEFNSYSWGIPFKVEYVYIYLKNTGDIIKKLDFMDAEG